MFFVNTDVKSLSYCYHHKVDFEISEKMKVLSITKTEIKFEPRWRTQRMSRCERCFIIFGFNSSISFEQNILNLYNHS